MRRVLPSCRTLRSTRVIWCAEQEPQACEQRQKPGNRRAVKGEDVLLGMTRGARRSNAEPHAHAPTHRWGNHLAAAESARQLASMARLPFVLVSFHDVSCDCSLTAHLRIVPSANPGISRTKFRSPSPGRHLLPACLISETIIVLTNQFLYLLQGPLHADLLALQQGAQLRWIMLLGLLTCLCEVQEA